MSTKKAISLKETFVVVDFSIKVPLVDQPEVKIGCPEPPCFGQAAKSWIKMKRHDSYNTALNALQALRDKGGDGTIVVCQYAG